MVPVPSDAHASKGIFFHSTTLKRTDTLIPRLSQGAESRHIVSTAVDFEGKCRFLSKAKVIDLKTTSGFRNPNLVKEDVIQRRQCALARSDLFLAPGHTVNGWLDRTLLADVDPNQTVTLFVLATSGLNPLNHGLSYGN